MNNQSMGRSDGLSACLTAFGCLYHTILMAVPDPIMAFALTVLATGLLAVVKTS
jgi:hypothetical protein